MSKYSMEDLGLCETNSGTLSSDGGRTDLPTQLSLAEFRELLSDCYNFTLGGFGDLFEEISEDAARSEYEEVGRSLDSILVQYGIQRETQWDVNI